MLKSVRDTRIAKLEDLAYSEQAWARLAAIGRHHTEMQTEAFVGTAIANLFLQNAPATDSKTEQPDAKMFLLGVTNVSEPL
mmetsp:Transcript_21436/g.47815  ORF Transcript_21436/g.47815 Transcript_21436/m.47815 type:complete len:81 (+) Transcript_21436:1136-1378(+)